MNNSFWFRFSWLRRLAWIACWTGFIGVSQAQTNFQIIKSFGFPALSTGSSPRSQMILGNDGVLYGVTTQGGSNLLGVVFSVNTDGTGYQVLHSFGGGTNDGSYPAAELLQASDGMLYGTTEDGGTNNCGIIFKINTDGTGFSQVHAFNGYTDGEESQGGLLQGREDGVLYGTTSTGGTGYGGTIFKVNTDGSGFLVLTNLNVKTGTDPLSGMVEGADGYLYGTTFSDGDYEGAGYNGGIFKLSRDGSSFQNLHYFQYEPFDGDVADGRLVQGSDGYLYGTCEQGGNPSMGIYSYIGNGTLYKINTNGNSYQIIYEFPTSATNGANPFGGLHFGSDGYLYGAASSGGPGKAGSLFKIPTTGGTPTIIHNFAGTDGSAPDAAIIPGPGGTTFYGTAYGGGSFGFGTAFQVADDGSSFSVLHNFTSLAGGDGTSPQGPVSVFGNVVYGTTSGGAAAGAGAAFSMNLNGSDYQFLHSFTNGNGDGYQIQAALLKAADGFLYGTTEYGGTNGYGTVFKVSADGGQYSILHTFTNAPGDGSAPFASLIQGADGALYGTTSEGGSNYDGTVFKLNTDGSGYTILCSFAGNPDGSYPVAPLIQDSFGVLYGTTEDGGSNGYGTVFSLTTNGTSYQVLHNFAGATGDGGNPQAGLLLGQNNMLYGTTYGGGTNYSGTVFTMNTNGSNYNVLYNFTGGFDGAGPQAQLVQGHDGSLYGTCSSDDINYDGTVFKLNTNGENFAVLHEFSNQDCSYPVGGLALAADGSLWGVASLGGSMNNGAVFKLFSVPEIITLPSYSPAGVTLNFTGGVANQNYQILASTDLIHWAPIVTLPADANGSLQYVDTNASNYQIRFYRTSGP